MKLALLTSHLLMALFLMGLAIATQVVESPYDHVRVLEPTFRIVHQSERDVAHASSIGFRNLAWKEHARLRHHVEDLPIILKCGIRHIGAVIEKR